LAATGISYTYVNSNDLTTKQNVLDASTNLLGIGTNISALNYLSISVNHDKPTNFQSDWDTTIINNLTLYAIKNHIDSSLNTITNSLSNKENALTFSTPLKRTLNAISIDLSGYILSSTASSTYATT
jgi:hypothetical protein